MRLGRVFASLLSSRATAQILRLGAMAYDLKYPYGQDGDALFASIIMKSRRVGENPLRTRVTAYDPEFQNSQDGIALFAGTI